MPEQPFPHLDAAGRARMVDVSEKAPTRRRAVAEGRVRVAPSTLEAIRRGAVAKGDVLAVARIAGIQAAKLAPSLIPLCHPIRLDAVEVHVTPEGDDRVVVRAVATAYDRTGVEMEALTAVAGAALSVYDMVKSLDRSAEIETVRLLAKEGGRSGSWARPGSEGM